MNPKVNFDQIECRSLVRNLYLIDCQAVFGEYIVLGDLKPKYFI